MSSHPKNASGKSSPSIQVKYSLRDCLFISLTFSLNILGWAGTVAGMVGLELAVESGSSMGWVVVLFTPMLAVFTLLLALSGTLHPGEYRFLISHLLLLLTALEAMFSDKTAVSIPSFAALNRSTWFLSAYTAGAIVQMFTQILWIMYLSSEANSSVVRIFERFDSNEVAANRTLKRRTMQSMWSVPNLHNLPSANAAAKSSPIAPAVDSRSSSRLQNSSVAPSFMTGVGGSELTLQFNYRAKALYSYQSDPSDPNELSFNQGDSFDIANPHGNKWWHALKADGTIGIVPSNYFELLDN